MLWQTTAPKEEPLTSNVLARLPRDPYVWRALAAGLLGSAATMAFLFATQTGLLSVVSVVAPLYPAFTVLLAVLALHERIGRGQGFGLVLAGLAVALVTGG